MPETRAGKTRKKILMVSLAIVLSVTGTLMFVFYTAHEYSGSPSDHFDGSRFFNPEHGDHTFRDMLKWMWEMKTVSWPDWVEDPEQSPPPERTPPGTLRVTFVNHATILIQMDGLNILTDPIWSARAGPMSWVGPRRVRAPGVAMEKLPKIDYVLISHDHYDHLDLSTLEVIVERDHPMILAGLGVMTLLPDRWAPDVQEMDWWQTHKSAAAGTVFTFVPARHSSGRWPFMENLTLWGGFVIESPSGEQVYYVGDTGYDAFLESIRDHFKRIRLAILPLGNYEKRWFMKNQHMNPDDAVQAHLLLGAQQSIGVHFSTFAEHPEQTIDAHEHDLAAALKKHMVPPSQFWILGFGEGRDVPQR